MNTNIDTANILDLVCLPSGQRGRVDGSSVRHITLRVADEGEQMVLGEKLLKRGFNVTPQLDRNYFKSLYFREPGERCSRSPQIRRDLQLTRHKRIWDRN